MSLSVLDTLADKFLLQVESRLGDVARPNGTFFSYRVATTAIQRLRLDVIQNKQVLTERGEGFAAEISAYLARLAFDNWSRRGLEVVVDACYEGNSETDAIKVTAARIRDGQKEIYQHDFLRDCRELLINPPQWFPWMHTQVYAVESVVLPSPEYLLLYGAFLMQSPRDLGNWPKPGRVGGLEADFDQSKELLVNDLHTDCGLPLDHAGMRKLSWWIVFPPYGWQMNDGQEYNMMTIFSQISHKEELPFDQGMEYLYGLLRCQALYIQNLAARCLMVYQQPPRNALEGEIYRQAVSWRDYPEAAAAMNKFQWQMERTAANTGPSRAWLDEAEQQRQQLAHSFASELTVSDPAFNDPDYLALEGLGEEHLDEGIAGLEQLAKRYPDSWNIKTLLASQLMKRSPSGPGEQILREQIKDPVQPEAHLRLGTMLKHQGRMEESMQVYEDGVRRWPRHTQLIDSCMWLVTEEMTADPNPADLVKLIDQFQAMMTAQPGS